MIYVCQGLEGMARTAGHDPLSLKTSQSLSIVQDPISAQHKAFSLCLRDTSLWRRNNLLIDWFNGYSLLVGADITLSTNNRRTAVISIKVGLSK